MSRIHCSVVSARLAVGALFCLFSLPAQAQTGYTIQGLGGLGTDANRHVISVPDNLNIRGQVVGRSNQYNAKHTSLGIVAFLARNGGIQNLSAAGFFGTDSNGSSTSEAYGINDSGQITGASIVYDTMHNLLGQAAFLWQNGVFTNLGNFGTSTNGSANAIAYRINNLGQVVGFSEVYDNQHNDLGPGAFLWQSGKGLTNLGNFGTNSANPPQGSSRALAINNLTQIVGDSDVYDSGHNSLGTAAFLWQNNVLTNLGNFGTDNSTPGRGYSTANAINNLSQVVGGSRVYDVSHNLRGFSAFFYDFVQTKTMTELPTLGTGKNGALGAIAFGINDKGQIVGYSSRYDTNGNYVEDDAALWQGNTVVNLNDYIPSNSGWLLTNATAINNRGQISGYGMHNGTTEAFLLTPYEAGDFTRDGNPDILLRNSLTGDLTLGVMTGTNLLGSQSILSNVSLDWKVVATPDLNGDGYADIVWQNSKTGDVAYWLMNNGHFVSYGYLYYGNGQLLNWKIVGSADFNGDGYPDLVLQDSQTGTIAVWYLTGTDYFDYGLIGTNPGTGWQVAGAGDMNGDGQPDLLLRSKANGDLYAWELNGLTVSKGVLIANVPLNWNLVGLGDFGGDGNTSLLWQDSKTNDLYHWLMNGTTNVGYGLIQSGVANWQVVGPK